jgi:hypothetical protein
MEQRAMRTVGILGLVAILGLMTLWLFGLQTVGDPAAAASGAKIHQSLKRSLDDKVEMREAVRVTMVRMGKGREAPRHYTIRLRVSPAVAADQTATRRLLARAADIAAGNVKNTGGGITFTGIGIKPDGAEIEAYFQRVQQGAGYSVVPMEAPPVSSGGPGEK